MLWERDWGRGYFLVVGEGLKDVSCSLPAQFVVQVCRKGVVTLRNVKDSDRWLRIKGDLNGKVCVCVSVCVCVCVGGCGCVCVCVCVGVGVGVWVYIIALSCILQGSGGRFCEFKVEEVGESYQLTLHNYVGNKYWRTPQISIYACCYHQ